MGALLFQFHTRLCTRTLVTIYFELWAASFKSYGFNSPGQGRAEPLSQARTTTLRVPITPGP